MIEALTFRGPELCKASGEALGHPGVQNGPQPRFGPFPIKINKSHELKTCVRGGPEFPEMGGSPGGARGEVYEQPCGILRIFSGSYADPAFFHESLKQKHNLSLPILSDPAGSCTDPAGKSATPATRNVDLAKNPDAWILPDPAPDPAFFYGSLSRNHRFCWPAGL